MWVKKIINNISQGKNNEKKTIKEFEWRKKKKNLSEEKNIYVTKIIIHFTAPCSVCLGLGYKTPNNNASLQTAWLGGGEGEGGRAIISSCVSCRWLDPLASAAAAGGITLSLSGAAVVGLRLCFEWRRRRTCALPARGLLRPARGCQSVYC